MGIDAYPPLKLFQKNIIPEEDTVLVSTCF